MSLDTNALLVAVKRAALDAVHAEKPFALSFGKVVSVSPLKIKVDQKLTLTAAQLVLTNAVRDFTVNMTVNHSTGSALTSHKHSVALTSGSGGDPSHTHSVNGETEAVNLEHTHTYKGTKSFKVLLGLSVGEQVILLRADGGQKYIVLDRVEAPS